ncbi:hypothetical protein AAGG49_22105, partial [Stenotrophomonas maltophilia]|uniref:hypothetical protein n=1 Tax=Stenotrophomonas maltophilia TaxID=40324 RepID=UPI00313D2366
RLNKPTKQPGKQQKHTNRNQKMCPGAQGGVGIAMLLGRGKKKKPPQTPPKVSNNKEKTTTIYN